MRSKRVRLVTRTRTVPRSESRSLKVRESRSTDTTVPSNSRVWAEAAGALAASAAAAIRVTLRDLCMVRSLPGGPPSAW
jgi:hypothetical protein